MSPPTVARSSNLNEHNQDNPPVLVRVTVTEMKYHAQKQLGERKNHLFFASSSLFIIEERQELKEA